MRHSVARLAVLALVGALLAPAIGADEPSCHDAHAAPPASAETPTATTDEARALDLPRVALVDQDGARVDLYDDLIADRVVAMNFIFTTCTTVCPPMGASFGRLQRELGDLLGDEVELVSVSIDPTTDTPPRLKSWGERFGAGEAWSLVTGAKQDVDLVLKALEVFTPTPEDHGPIVLLGNDRTDTWVRVNGLTPPAKLAEMLEDLIAADAPRAAGEAR